MPTVKAIIGKLCDEKVLTKIGLLGTSLPSKYFPTTAQRNIQAQHFSKLIASFASQLALYGAPFENTQPESFTKFLNADEKERENDLKVERQKWVAIKAAEKLALETPAVVGIHPRSIERCGLEPPPACEGISH